jgi:hypothetical protein
MKPNNKINQHMACLKQNTQQLVRTSKSRFLPVITVLFLLIYQVSVSAQTDNRLKNSLPAAGKLVKDKPVGKGWVDLLSTSASWNFEDKYWHLENHVLHGEMAKEKEHHYSYTKESYKDFELNVLIKMVGDEDANSGVCIRIQPTNWDNAPGYQVDMGKGYWGSLWEERRGNMIQKFPDSLVGKVVKQNDWNHYYILAKGHHIQAWLNGIKTIDIDHEAGFLDGNIGFQLCHYHTPTTVDIKSLYIREIK